MPELKKLLVVEDQSNPIEMIEFALGDTLPQISGSVDIDYVTNLEDAKSAIDSGVRYDLRT